MQVTNMTRQGMVLPVKKGKETTFVDLAAGETRSIAGLDMDHASVKGGILSSSISVETKTKTAPASETSSGIKSSSKPAGAE